MPVDIERDAISIYIAGEEKELVVALERGVDVLLLDDSLGCVFVLLLLNQIERDLATLVLLVLVEEKGSDTRVAVLFVTSYSY